jgi:hypothetical protein
MAKMTKAQAKRLLMAASNKCLKVFVDGRKKGINSLNVDDMKAIDKIIDRAINRIK